MPIPEHHWSLSLRGRSGLGKSRFASLLSNKISKKENLPIIVVCAKNKIESTIPWYEENCEEFRQWKGITWGLIRRLKNHILVLEDIPLLMRTKYRRTIIESVVTALARGNRIFTITTTQHTRRLPTTMTVYFSVKNNVYRYRVVEEIRTTEWVNWTCNSKFPSDYLNVIVDCLYNGVSGTSEQIGELGRPANPESFRNMCLKAFDSGKDASELVEELGLKHNSRKYRNVYVYFWQFKSKRSRK